MPVNILILDLILALVDPLLYCLDFTNKQQVLESKGCLRPVTFIDGKPRSESSWALREMKSSSLISRRLRAYRMLGLGGAVRGHLLDFPGSSPENFLGAGLGSYAGMPALQTRFSGDHVRLPFSPPRE